MAKNTKKVEKNEFDESIAASVSFFEKNKTKILTCCGVVVAVIICALLVHQFIITPRNQKAEESIFAAQTLFQTGDYEKALNGDETTMGFLAIADKFKCTKTANVAKLYAGICYAETGKYEEAVKMLNSYDGKGDALISPAAIAALGNCYAQLGQNEKAVEYLLKAAKQADNDVLSPTYLIEAGQLYEAMEKPEKALECYKQVKEKYQQSLQFNEIDKYIERLSK